MSMDIGHCRMGTGMNAGEKGHHTKKKDRQEEGNWTISAIYFVGRLDSRCALMRREAFFLLLASC